MDDKNYSILNKDNLTIQILRAGHDIGQIEFYLEVDDLDALWNSMKDKLGGQVKEPVDRECYTGAAYWDSANQYINVYRSRNKKMK